MDDNSCLYLDYCLFTRTHCKYHLNGLSCDPCDSGKLMIAIKDASAIRLLSTYLEINISSTFHLTLGGLLHGF